MTGQCELCNKLVEEHLLYIDPAINKITCWDCDQKKYPLIEEISLDIGTTTRVTLNKIFGPFCAMDLRISINTDSLDWVIERSVHGEWIKWVSIPAQMDQDFCTPVEPCKKCVCISYESWSKGEKKE